MSDYINATSDIFIRYLFEKLPQAHNCFLAIEKNNPEYFLCDDFQIHFLELPKIKEDNILNMKSSLIKWAFFLKNEGKEELEEKMEALIKDEPILLKAHDNYRKFTANDEMRELYEARMKSLNDRVTNLSLAHDEGREEGREEALIITAQKMKDQGLALDMIKKITNLSDNILDSLK